MKTLDEVIKALENVALADTDGESEGYFLAVDALHYLKMYRSEMRMYAENQKYWETELKQKIKDFGDAKDRYIAKLKELDIGTLNEPLTWDELKAMEGKPVWVELLYHHPEQKYKYWDVIKRFDAVEGYDLIDLAQTGYLYKSLLNREWQAFRKGRHESTDSN